jgi:hypothetical protein
MIASGATPTEAARTASARFKLGRRQGERYVSRVLEQWATDDKRDRHARKLTLRRRLEAFYVKAMDADQYGPALQALDRLARVDGLFAPESVKVQHEGNLEIAALSMTTDAIRQRVDKLLARRAEVLGSAAPSIPSNGKASGGTN